MVFGDPKRSSVEKDVLRRDGDGNPYCHSTFDEAQSFGYDAGPEHDPGIQVQRGSGPCRRAEGYAKVKKLETAVGTCEIPR